MTSSPLTTAQVINEAIAEDIIDDYGLLFFPPDWTNTDYSNFWEATTPEPATPLSAYGDEPYDDEDEEGCQGHPAGPFDPMGETVYCDGTCR